MNNKKNSAKKNALMNRLHNYLKKIYCSKLIIWKCIIFFSIGFVVLLSSFLIRDAVLNSTQSSRKFIPNFIDIELVFNPGVAFSSLSNMPFWFVYFVQAIPLIIGAFTFIFSKSVYLDVGIAFLFFGGMCNIIDRSIVDITPNLYFDDQYHTVVDYLKFSSKFIGNFAIFNLPDVYVVFSVIYIVVFLAINFISETVTEKQNKNLEKKNI